MAMRSRKLVAVLGLVILLLGAAVAVLTVTSRAEDSAAPAAVSEEAAADTDAAESATGSKAVAAGIAIGLAALGGAIGMGIAIAKSAEGISRQPEAGGSIRSSMMLGLVFIETAIIYALVVAILIIFVL